MELVAPPTFGSSSGQHGVIQVPEMPAPHRPVGVQHGQIPGVEDARRCKGLVRRDVVHGAKVDVARGLQQRPAEVIQVEVARTIEEQTDAAAAVCSQQLRNLEHGITAEGPHPRVGCEAAGGLGKHSALRLVALLVVVDGVNVHHAVLEETREDLGALPPCRAGFDDDVHPGDQRRTQKRQTLAREDTLHVRLHRRQDTPLEKGRDAPCCSHQPGGVERKMTLSAYPQIQQHQQDNELTCQRPWKNTHGTRRPCAERAGRLTKS
mmetsp:Transcript_94899/g.305459  ORF Transcript_94899/g.305459 Transcript_94899/m.305459 type:complete len:264 (+) Transcript_94899:1256-2047(+)